MKNKKNKETQNRISNPNVRDIVESYVDEETLKTDPNGSYTGKNLVPFEMPIQDADDL